MGSLSRRAKIIVGIVIGIIVVAAGVIIYLQKTGKVSIWAATSTVTATPSRIGTYIGYSNTITVTPARKFEVVCKGLNKSNAPLRTVEIVGGTNTGVDKSSKKFSSYTSSFSIKAVAEGSARCIFSSIIPSQRKGAASPSITFYQINDSASASNTSDADTSAGGSTAGNTISLDPSSLNLRHNDSQTVYLSSNAGPVVTVKCSNGAQALNGSTAGGTLTFRNAANVPFVAIKAAPSAASSVCQFFQSESATGTPAAQLQVTTYD